MGNILIEEEMREDRKKGKKVLWLKQRTILEIEATTYWKALKVNVEHSHHKYIHVTERTCLYIQQFP